MAKFEISVVTERFIQVFDFLKDRGFFERNKEFANNIDYLPQSLGEVLKGRRDVTIEVIRKLVTEYPVSLEYIFIGEGPILVGDKNKWLPKWLPRWLPLDGKSPDLRKSKSTTLEKERNESSLFLPDHGKTIGTSIIELPIPMEDESELVAVPMVDISVAAGSGFCNPDYLSEIDCIRMPRSMVKGRQPHLCVRIKGESMVPTLQDGGFLIIRLLDPSEWRDIRDGHVYVVAEKEGKAFVKRLKNRFVEHGFIVCMSDSADVQRYPNFNLMDYEINTIWHAEWYISAKMPNIHATYYNKVTEMEDAIEEIRTTFSNEMQSMRKELRALTQE